MGKSNFKSNFYIGKMGLGTKENAVRGKKGCRTLHDKIYSINVKIYSLEDNRRRVGRMRRSLIAIMQLKKLSLKCFLIYIAFYKDGHMVQ